jgi:hypothetical protein
MQKFEELVSEMPNRREHHRQAQTARGLDDLLIAHRPSGLNNGSGACLCNFLNAVREGKENCG